MAKLFGTVGIGRASDEAGDAVVGRQESHPESLVVLGVCGLVCVSSFVVMGLWLTGLASEISLFNTVPLFYFNTALGFGICATAVFALHRHPKMAVILGCLLAALSVITLGEYVLGLDFGVDQLLARGPTNDNNYFPGRMAESSAISFLVASLTVITYAIFQRSSTARLFAGFFGSLIFAMGAVGLAGHIWGLGPSFTWAGQRSMAVLTAANFCLVGFALTIHFLGTLPNASSVRRRQFPALVGLSLAVGTLFLWNAFKGYDRERINSSTETELKSICKQLSLSLDARILSLDRMAKRWAFEGKIERGPWEADANLYIQHMAGIEGVAKLSSVGIVDWIVPSPAMDAVIGFDLKSEPNRKGAIDEAVATRKIQLTKTLSLRTGGRGFLAAAPAFLNELFLGNIVMVFRIDKFVPASIESAHYDITIESEGEQSYKSQSAELAADDIWARSAAFDFKSLKWVIRARPKPSQIHEQSSSLPVTVLWVGLALSTLVMVLLRLYFKSREAEEGAWRSEQWQKAIIDGSDLMIVSTDENGIVQSFNPAAERILGFASKDVCGQHNPALWHSDDELKVIVSELSADQRSRVLDLKDAFFISARLSRHERKFRTLTNARGEIRRVLVGTHAFSNEAGQITGYVMIGEDMTELSASEERVKSQQAQILAASKMSSIGEMAGGVAHELNTPLNVILAKAQQLEFLAAQPEKLEPSEIIAQASSIVSTVDRMARIIRGLKTFAREASADPFQKNDVGRLVEETSAFCSARFRSHGIELRVNVDSGLVAECRESQMSQVILNLLNNAYEAVFQQDEKWIDITARKYLTGAEISVTNSGPHIALEVEEKIMQPFFSTKNAAQGKSQSQSQGLGLGLSKGIAESHRGWLRLDQFSQFTKFVVWIPNEQQQQLPQKAA